MSTTLYLDPAFDDDRRRAELYSGQVFVYSSRPTVRAFAEFARGLIEQAFAPLDPRTAQFELSVDRFA